MIEIIAEIGINHNGSLELARKLIKEAKASGADTVKFQAYITATSLEQTISICRKN